MSNMGIFLCDWWEVLYFCEIIGVSTDKDDIADFPLIPESACLLEEDARKWFVWSGMSIEEPIQHVWEVHTEHVSTISRGVFIGL